MARASALVAMVAGCAAVAAMAQGRPWGGAAPPPDETAPLRVIPFPGTPDAAATSQVIFGALRPYELRSVAVEGSRSGTHAGWLRALPDRAGTAFIPARPFTAGETVRVSAQLSSVRAGTESGDPGRTRLTFSFRVGVPITPPSIGRQRSSTQALAGRQGSMSQSVTGPNQSFHSAPHLRPPVMTVTPDPDRTSGDIFLAIQRSGQVGPMIVDSQGKLVWFHPVATASGKRFASDLAVQQYHGRPVLTWWQGVPLRRGEDVIMNSSYRRVALVRAANGYQADFHEFQITPQNTAMLDTGVFTYTNLTSVGGPPRGVVLDDVIQEVDIKTKKLLWEWHSLGHVPVSASYYPYDPSKAFYDYFHLNSIQQLPDGNLLVSARHTWSVYEISRKTGRVMWTLGGRYSDFKMGRGTNFEWQHDARLHGSVLSLFDDGAYPPEERQSSAKHLRIDNVHRTVSLVRRFVHAPPLLTGAAGNAQSLPNGDVFVGWGAAPVFSEYTPSGRQILNGSFAYGLTSYRALRFPWSGQPLTRPSLAVSAHSHRPAELYASWNGATRVTSWRVLGGSGQRDLRPVGVTARRTGFETAIRVARSPRFFAVQALNGATVLGTSAPVAAG